MNPTYARLGDYTLKIQAIDYEKKELYVYAPHTISMLRYYFWQVSQFLDENMSVIKLK